MVLVPIMKLFKAAKLVMISVKKKKCTEIVNCYLSDNSVTSQKDPHTNMSVYFSENYC